MLESCEFIPEHALLSVCWSFQCNFA